MIFISAQSQPPPILKLLSHDLRWQLVNALAESDRKVQELVEQLGRPQNLISHHLHKLRSGRLVTERRSIADARAIYSSLDLNEVRALFTEAGEALHPALSREAPDVEHLSKRPGSDPVRILFLCAPNSTRSQMAEGLLRTRGGDLVEAFSA